MKKKSYVKSIKKLFKNTICVLVFVLVKWFFVIQINKFNSYSKLNYFVSDDSQFMVLFDKYLNNSLSSLNEMKVWLRKNYQLANLTDENQNLFHNYNLVRDAKKTKGQKLICANVLSKQREGRRSYVIQTIVSLLTRLKLKYQDRILLNLFNVDSEPNNHHELDLLENIVHTVRLNDLKDKKFYKLIEGFESQSKVKESLDFSIIMNYIYFNQTLCDYALIIEDDAIAANNWYEKLVESIQLIDKNSNWFCLKLFTSYRYYDWLAHLSTVFCSIFLVLFVTFLSLCIYIFIMRRLAKYFNLGKYFKLASNNFYNKLTVSILFFNSLALVFAYNSFNISPLGYGVIKYSQGFNAVANVYPRSKLNQIARHIEYSVRSYVNGDVEKFEPKDIALKSYKNKYRLDEFIIEPSLFQHIGLHSSLGSIKEGFKFYLQQYRPFQSYSFNKEYLNLILFDPDYWLS